MAETIRTFIALELPRSVRAQIERIQQGLLHQGLKARWVKPDNVHLTLYFFGEISADRIEPIRDAMGEAAACGPFRLEARGLGVFPGLPRARVIWSGVGGDVESLKHLQRRLTEALAEELKDKGTRVNAILPSIIDTPANRKDMPDADFSSWVSTDELGNVIRFLLSAEASGVTGALIPVPGRV